VRVKSRLVRASGYLVLIVLSVGSMLPLLWMIVTSLRPNNTVFDGPIPKQVTVAAYQYAWSRMHILTYFLNSVYITAATVALVLAISLLAGYGFGRLRFRGREVLFVALMSALFLPAAAILIPVFLELKEFNLIGSQLGVILIYVATGVPFSTLLMRAFFASLPGELADAARIDGAGELRTFWHVMLPLAGPGVATISIFQVLFTWNELMFANALIQKEGLLPLQPKLYSLVGEYTTNWPALTAALTIAIVPILIVYMILQRWYVAGLTAAAVKG
jgi:ABC-type glycerol-3-phosphate transport system permease component